jgi:hypothetical protein
MQKKLQSTAFGLLALAVAAAPASAQLFVDGDPILAVDTDTGIHSSYPGGESPWNFVDQDPFTKYLNFGMAGTGAIITPVYGSAVVQSMQLTTAGDAPERDPGSWELYGTNDPIVSEDNGIGDGENWTMIASGDANLPDTRNVPGPIYTFANGNSYESYKVLFPTLKDSSTANSMQSADISLFTGTDGAGDQIIDAPDYAIAVGWFGSESAYPGLEGPDKAIDGDPFNKYLNFGQENCGFIVSRADGQAVVVEQFTITTANDWEERDPSSWELYGTNDPIASEDNSTGEAENWTLIDFGSVDLPPDRNTVGPTVAVANAEAYTGYKLLFPTIKLPSDWPGDSMQIAEILMEGTGGGCYADYNGDGAVNTQDFIAYLGAWAAGDLAADCNGDGVINTQDFLCFLGLWAAGC